MLGIAGSLIASVVMIIVPLVVERLNAPADGDLFVSITNESLADLWMLRIVAKNAGSYALNPLRFTPSVYPPKLRLAIESPNLSSMLPTDRVPAWEGSLAPGEELRVLMVADTPIETPAARTLFSGSYPVVGSRGAIETRNIRVLSAGEIDPFRLVLCARLVCCSDQTLFLVASAPPRGTP